MNGIICAVLSVFMCLVIHSLISLFRKDKIKYHSPMGKLLFLAKQIMVVWLCGLPVFIYLFHWSYQDKFLENFDKINITLFHLAYGVILFWMLFFLYLTLYYLVDRSVSTTLMIKIESSLDKKLTIEEIRNVYDIDKKYRDEISGMLAGGFIIKSGEYYKNTFKGSCFAKIANFFKIAYKLGPGG